MKQLKPGDVVSGGEGAIGTVIKTEWGYAADHLNNTKELVYVQWSVNHRELVPRPDLTNE